MGGRTLVAPRNTTSSSSGRSTTESGSTGPRGHAHRRVNPSARQIRAAIIPAADSARPLGDGPRRGARNATQDQRRGGAVRPRPRRECSARAPPGGPSCSAGRERHRVGVGHAAGGEMPVVCERPQTRCESDGPHETGHPVRVGQSEDGSTFVGGGGLAAALTLSRVDGTWVVEADARYEGFNGMFGGWTAAVALAAICRDGEAGRVPTALSVNYIAPIPAGVLVRIATRCVGSGRSVSHWSAELSGGDGDEVMATAMAVFAVRRPTDGHMQVTMPSAQRPEQITEWHPPMPVGELVDVRPVHGFPPFGRMDADSSEWVRETSGRPGDRMQLAFLADACAPRPAFWSERPRPSATLAMTIYFHATDDELAAVGNDYVLNEVTGARVTRPSLTSHCGCGADSGCCSHQASSCARTGRRQSRPSRSVAAGRGSTQPATRSRLGSFCATRVPSPGECFTHMSTQDNPETSS